MLDVKAELEMYQPIHLEAIEEDSGKLPEDTTEAIHLFNKALEDAKFGNEDMAIIALKKAISLHPGFYEAMNLLGICYMAIGREEMAEFAFNQVIDADDSSIKAQDYLNKMKGLPEGYEKTEPVSTKRKGRPAKASAIPKEKDGMFTAWLQKGLQKEDNSLYGLKYIVGILIGAIIITFIWYMVPTNKSLFIITRDEHIINDPELENQISKLNERIEKLEGELKNSREENLQLRDSFQQFKDFIARLEQADAEYKAGNYIEAADLLITMQENVPDGLKNELTALWDKVRLEAANQLYQEGNRMYDGNNTERIIGVYKQALEKFEKAITYIEDDRPSYMPVLYYQAGKAAARCDELERAIELFEAIINDYPNSQYRSYASVRLREIGEGRPISGT